MSTFPEFTLNLKNESDDAVSFAVYQKFPIGVFTQRLIWLTKSCNNGGYVNFKWKEKYSLKWLQKSNSDGVSNDASGEYCVDVTKGSRVKFGKDEYDEYAFGEAALNGLPGTIGVLTNKSVTRDCQIALTMGGIPIAITDADPNVELTFTPENFNYYIVFGPKFKVGEVIEVEQENTMLLPYYTLGTKTLSYTLNARNEWVVGV